MPLLRPSLRLQCASLALLAFIMIQPAASELDFMLLSAPPQQARAGGDRGQQYAVAGRQAVHGGVSKRLNNY